MHRGSRCIWSRGVMVETWIGPIDVALVALVLGMVSTGLSIILATFKLREYLTSRRRTVIAAVAPKLREIRSLVSSPIRADDIINANKLFWSDIVWTGFAEQLRRISFRKAMDKLAIDFEILYVICTEAKAVRREVSSDEEAARRASEIVSEIDMLLAGA